MTLDELNDLNRDADRAQRAARSVGESEVILARHRRDSTGFKRMYESLEAYGGGSAERKAAAQTLLEVIDEHLPDMLRVAELRLQAQGRTQRQKETLLRSQIDGFLSGGPKDGDHE